MQAVFILLWRKAGSIRGSVAGWLVKATYLACCDARKLAAARKYHERAAAMIKPEHSDIGTEAGWENYAKALDEAIVRLRAKDRNAVALRYLRGLSFREVGLAMGIGEDAAKTCVGRAIGRLREIMMSRKVAVPVAGVLATQMEMRCIEACAARDGDSHGGVRRFGDQWNIRRDDCAKIGDERNLGRGENFGNHSPIAWDDRVVTVLGDSRRARRRRCHTCRSGHYPEYQSHDRRQRCAQYHFGGSCMDTHSMAMANWNQDQRREF